MPRMTNAQLVDENIRLRHNIAVLERQLGDANELSRQAIERLSRQAPERIVGRYTTSAGVRMIKVRISDRVIAHRPEAQEPRHA